MNILGYNIPELVLGIAFVVIAIMVFLIVVRRFIANLGSGCVIRAVVRGALLATVLAFPVAVCAALFRFPVPFAGFQSGFAAIPSVLVGAVFYGLLGGFPVLLIGAHWRAPAAYTLYPADQQRMRRLITVFAGGVAAACVVLLAILDKLIGPW